MPREMQGFFARLLLIASDVRVRSPRVTGPRRYGYATTRKLQLMQMMQR